VKHAAVLLFACGLAVAAPTPKTNPKLEDVFGEIVDKKSDCKFEMGKEGALTITAPTSPKAFKLNGKTFLPPLVEKEVEGDFELTVRIGLLAPKGAKAVDGEKDLSVVAGVSVIPPGTPFGAMGGLLQNATEKGWSGKNFGCYHQFKASHVSSTRDLKLDPDTPLVVRLTRQGEEVTTECKSGDEWVLLNFSRVDGMTGKVKVGPTVAGNIDQPFTATFDQYEIKPLKEEKK